MTHAFINRTDRPVIRERREACHWPGARRTSGGRWSLTPGNGTGKSRSAETARRDGRRIYRSK